MQVRYPDGGFDHGQSLGQTPFSAPNDFPVWITDDNPLGYHCRFDKTDPFLKEDFTCTLAEEDAQSPGLPNSEMNAAYIDSLRNCGGHRGPVAYDAPPIAEAGKTGKKELTASAQEGLPAYDLVKAFPNPYDRTVSLDIQSGQAGWAKLRVYSASGQALIGQDYFLEAGGNGFELEGSQNLGPGLHILQLVFPSGRVAHLRLIRIE